MVEKSAKKRKKGCQEKCQNSQYYTEVQTKGARLKKVKRGTKIKVKKKSGSDHCVIDQRGYSLGYKDKLRMT